MDDAGVTRDDLKIPDGDLGTEIRAAVAEGRDILVHSTFEEILVLSYIG
jgi:hypothetical protein